jgi:hypothetical protein
MRVSIFFATAALLAAATVQAQPINGAPSVLTVPTTATSSPGVPPQVPGPEGKKDPMICKTQDQIGSRLGAKRICMTKSQWAQQTYDARQMTSQVQTQPH